MADSFGPFLNTQEVEKEGGGFYSTVSADIEPGRLYKPNASTNLFGFCNEKVYANGRYWFSNKSLGQTKAFDRPASWTSVEGQKIYLTAAGVVSATAAGNTLIGWEVDSVATAGTNSIKVCIAYNPG